MQEEFVEVEAMPRFNRAHTSQRNSSGSAEEDLKMGVACFDDGSTRKALPMFCSLSSNSKSNTSRPDGHGVAMRTRSYRYMSAEEREILSLGLAHGHLLQTMASVLGRALSIAP